MCEIAKIKIVVASSSSNEVGTRGRSALVARQPAKPTSSVSSAAAPPRIV
jgi:hypothetical protein